MRDLAQQRELTHGRIDDETPKEMLLEFTVISDRLLQGDEDAACRSQPLPPAQARSEPAARADVPISGTAYAMRRSQQKVQPTSRMKISRDSECDEPQVLRGSSEHRQGHSRNHVEEGV